MPFFVARMNISYFYIPKYLKNVPGGKGREHCLQDEDFLGTLSKSVNPTFLHFFLAQYSFFFSLWFLGYVFFILFCEIRMFYFWIDCFFLPSRSFEVSTSSIFFGLFLHLLFNIFLHILYYYEPYYIRQIIKTITYLMLSDFKKSECI